jgi:hypothetical protein
MRRTTHKIVISLASLVIGHFYENQSLASTELCSRKKLPLALKSIDRNLLKKRLTQQFKENTTTISTTNMNQLVKDIEQYLNSKLGAIAENSELEPHSVLGNYRHISTYFELSEFLSSRGLKLRNVPESQKLKTKSPDWYVDGFFIEYKSINPYYNSAIETDWVVDRKTKKLSLETYLKAFPSAPQVSPESLSEKIENELVKQISSAAQQIQSPTLNPQSFTERAEKPGIIWVDLELAAFKKQYTLEQLKTISQVAFENALTRFNSTHLAQHVGAIGIRVKSAKVDFFVYDVSLGKIITNNINDIAHETRTFIDFFSTTNADQTIEALIEAPVF